MSMPNTSASNSSSMSSSYNRIVGSRGGDRVSGANVSITGGQAGPQLSPATTERLRLAEARRLDEERRAAERRRLMSMSPLERAGEMQKQINAEMQANKSAWDRMQAVEKQKRYGTAPVSMPKYSPKPSEFTPTFKGV